ncbi:MULTISPECIES: TRAP transporter small permease [unclassified Sulfitobacter]|uniref:TRAP transporter small permease n=1 Tax=unclassified Sulfitobacter TaxID=196795 RepID=UPI0007C35FB2|nr:MULTISPECIES: TRAP transporter small permease [unclassified Sulfitobacter]KZX94125.1 C4-dicarboxylate ABC transporter permease [Sulfitobacter sp. HI0023]KZY25382.1 C4-dicarboxylate ABC transporter permease [Sulfitobacter sp. HI0040]KZZ69366.1 C4-dicarboxylate ABC transporter permease [Sulfitobacter sp. HI0129]
MHRTIGFLARFTALVGGLVLVAIILLTTASIIGRTLNKTLHGPFFQEKMQGFAQWMLDLGIGEINGNYELLEAGVAFAIFSFLPICQYYGVHATVDVFTSFLGRRTTRWIAAFWEVILTAVILLIVWRLYGGMERYIRNGETTLFLQFPVWWAYACSFAAGVVASIVAIYCAIMRTGEALIDRDLLPHEFGAH